MSRGRFIFWLDYSKDEELLLAETIDDLKAKRSFARTIRDGIRLICDLRAGRVDVLFELFPWVKAEFITGVRPQTDDRIMKQLRQMERMLLEQGNTPIPLPSGNPKQLSGPKQLNVPQLAAPKVEDGDDVLLVKKDTSTDSASNFLKSVIALQNS